MHACISAQQYCNNEQLHCEARNFAPHSKPVEAPMHAFTTAIAALHTFVLFGCFERMLFAYLTPASWRSDLNVLLAQLLRLVPSVAWMHIPRAEKGQQRSPSVALHLASRILAHAQLLRLTDECAKF